MLGGGTNDPLPREELVAWAEFMSDMVDMKPLMFSRSTKPENSVGRPWLIGFHDCSLSAFCMVVYILWKVQGEQPVGHSMVHQEKTNSGGPISGPLVGQTVVPNKVTSSGGTLGGPFRGKST